MREGMRLKLLLRSDGTGALVADRAENQTQLDPWATTSTLADPGHTWRPRLHRTHSEWLASALPCVVLWGRPSTARNAARKLIVTAPPPEREP